MFNISNQVIDDQDDFEELGVRPLSYSQSLIHSAHDSTESIATPPDSDLEDQQLRKMLASPLYTEVSVKPDAESAQKREANAQRTQSLSLKTRKFDVKFFSRLTNLQGNLVQCFRATVNRVITRFPKETEVTNRETVSRVVFILFLELLTPTNVGKILLDVNKDHLLNQARSELMKQEHQVGSLNNCMDELQQQACAQRLELENAHHGYAESRREQVRPQEDLVMKQKALRDTQIRSMHEVEK